MNIRLRFCRSLWHSFFLIVFTFLQAPPRAEARGRRSAGAQQCDGGRRFKRAHCKPEQTVILERNHIASVGAKQSWRNIRGTRRAQIAAAFS